MRSPSFFPILSAVCYCYRTPENLYPVTDGSWSFLSNSNTGASNSSPDSGLSFPSTPPGVLTLTTTRSPVPDNRRLPVRSSVTDASHINPRSYTTNSLVSLVTVASSHHISQISHRVEDNHASFEIPQSLLPVANRNESVQQTDCNPDLTAKPDLDCPSYTSVPVKTEQSVTLASSPKRRPRLRGLSHRSSSNRVITRSLPSANSIRQHSNRRHSSGQSVTRSYSTRAKTRLLRNGNVNTRKHASVRFKKTWFPSRFFSAISLSNPLVLRWQDFPISLVSYDFLQFLFENCDWCGLYFTPLLFVVSCALLTSDCQKFSFHFSHFRTKIAL